MGSVAPGASWLVAPVGAHPQFTGADFTENDVLYARTAEDFVRDEVLPRLDEIESKQEGLMPALLKRAGELGLLMIDIPEALRRPRAAQDHLDAGLGARRAVRVVQRLVGRAHRHRHAADRLLRQRGAEASSTCRSWRRGEWLAAYALTEPGSGSDALGARTRAERAARRHASGSPARSSSSPTPASPTCSPSSPRSTASKFTAFLVERTTPGLSTGPEEKKLGIRGSSTRQLILEDATVPADAVLGEIGQGHKIAFNILNIGRFKLGAGAVRRGEGVPARSPSTTRATASSSAARSRASA